jgi:hypothetical protein
MLQAEADNRDAAEPAKSESKQSKPGRGGKRPGAGRKPDPTKLLRGVSKESLADAVVNIDIAEVVSGLLRSKREVIRLQALNFLYDRVFRLALPNFPTASN